MRKLFEKTIIHDDDSMLLLEMTETLYQDKAPWYLTYNVENDLYICNEDGAYQWFEFILFWLYPSIYCSEVKVEDGSKIWYPYRTRVDDFIESEMMNTILSNNPVKVLYSNYKRRKTGVDFISSYQLA